MLICESSTNSGTSTELMGRTAFYEQQLAASDKDTDFEAEGPAVKKIDFPKVKRTPFSLAASYANSPRRAHLAQAGGDTLYHRGCILIWSGISAVACP